MRSYLQSYGPRERRTAMRDLIVEVAKVRIRKFQVENLNDPTEDLIFHIKYELPKAFHVLTDGKSVRQLVGTVPAIWEQYLLEVDFDDSRVTPFDLEMPLSITSKTVFRLPTDCELLDSHRLAAEKKTKFMQWTARVNQGEGEFVVESSVRRGIGYYPPEEFEQYHNDAQEVVAALRGPIKLRMKSIPSDSTLSN